MDDLSPNSFVRFNQRELHKERQRAWCGYWIPKIALLSLVCFVTGYYGLEFGAFTSGVYLAGVSQGARK